MLKRPAFINRNITAIGFAFLLLVATAILANHVDLVLAWHEPTMADQNNGIWKIEQRPDGTYEGIIEIEVDNLDADGEYTISVDVVPESISSECAPPEGVPMPPECLCVPLGDVPPEGAPEDIQSCVTRLDSGPLRMSPRGKAKGKTKDKDKGKAKKPIVTGPEEVSWGEIKLIIE